MSCIVKFLLKFKRSFFNDKLKARFTTVPFKKWFVLNGKDSMSNHNHYRKKTTFLKVKGSVREKLKGVKAYGEKLAFLIASNLTLICCVYKEKIIINDSC